MARPDKALDVLLRGVVKREKHHMTKSTFFHDFSSGNDGCIRRQADLAAARVACSARHSADHYPKLRMPVLSPN